MHRPSEEVAHRKHPVHPVHPFRAPIRLQLDLVVSPYRDIASSENEAVYTLSDMLLFYRGSASTNPREDVGDGSYDSCHGTWIRCTSLTWPGSDSKVEKLPGGPCNGASSSCRNIGPQCSSPPAATSTLVSCIAASMAPPRKWCAGDDDGKISSVRAWSCQGTLHLYDRKAPHQPGLYHHDLASVTKPNRDTVSRTCHDSAAAAAAFQPVLLFHAVLVVKESTATATWSDCSSITVTQKNQFVYRVGPILLWKISCLFVFHCFFYCLFWNKWGLFTAVLTNRSHTECHLCYPWFSWKISRFSITSLIKKRKQK